MRSIRLFTARLFSLCVALVFLIYVPVTRAQDKFGLYNSAKGTGVLEKSVPEVMGTIILNVLGIVGVIFLILIIYGGITWMTSAGNEQRISLAKKIITSSVIGLVIVMTGYAVTYFIVQNLTTATGSQQPGSGGT